MILCLIGRSGSGKTTVSEILTHHNFIKLKSWTSRAPRPGDDTNNELIFSTREHMKKLFDDGFFLEMKEYQGCLYGTENIDLKSDKDYVKVIEKQGYLEIDKKMRDIGGPDVISIYLDISRETSIERCSNRQGCTDEAVMNRVDKDDVIYGEEDICYTHIIDAEQSIEKVTEEVLELIKKYRE